MDKIVKETSMTVQNPRTGEFMTVRGFGAMRDFPLALRPGIDLTKPIYEQVLKLDREDERKRKRAEKRRLEKKKAGPV